LEEALGLSFDRVLMVMNILKIHFCRNKNVAPTSGIFQLSDDGFHAPHQLRPDLRDRNPQVRAYALARVESTMEPSLVVPPSHDVHRTSICSRDRNPQRPDSVQRCYTGDHTTWQRSPIHAPITIHAA